MSASQPDVSKLPDLKPGEASDLIDRWMTQRRRSWERRRFAREARYVLMFLRTRAGQSDSSTQSIFVGAGVLAALAALGVSVLVGVAQMLSTTVEFSLSVAPTLGWTALLPVAAIVGYLIFAVPHTVRAARDRRRIAVIERDLFRAGRQV